MNKFLTGLALAMAAILLALLAVFVGVLVVKELLPEKPAVTQETVAPWADEDGYAVVGDKSTPRFAQWLVTYFEDKGFSVIDRGGWWQASKSGEPTASWGEWGQGFTLSDVDGLYDGKSIFVAMRDSQGWVLNDGVRHYTCSGSYIAAYKGETMGSYIVSDSTILQFDGDKSAIEKIVNEFTSEWSKIREDLDGCTP